jgi:hypothetical protein
MIHFSVAPYDSHGYGGCIGTHLLKSCSSCPLYNISARTAQKTPLIVVRQSIPWEQVCLRRRYSGTTVHTYLLRICCLEADVVSLFVSRSLPSNESTRSNIVHTTLSYILKSISILSSHILLGLPSGLFWLSHQNPICYTSCQSHPSRLHHYIHGD